MEHLTTIFTENYEITLFIQAGETDRTIRAFSCPGGPEKAAIN